jgi:ribose transport system ATP-binding protein
MPELIGLCDRILVLHEGRLVGEVAAGAATEEALIQMAMGGGAAEAAAG